MKLSAYLRRFPKEGSRLARRLGVSHAAVSEWKKGRKRPAFPRAVELEIETEGMVPVEDSRPDLARMVRYLRQSGPRQPKR